MENLKEKFKHLKSDQINDGVYIAFQWADKRLCRIYIGTKTAGPILQWYMPDPDLDIPEYELNISGVKTRISGYQYLYDGEKERIFLAGAWTPVYSRGNFGKKYAHGGNWSGHTKNLLASVMHIEKPVDKTTNLIKLGNDFQELPDGIRGDVEMTEVDCSMSWTIWFDTAAEAINNRLDPVEIQRSSLPDVAKKHLKIETNDVITRVTEVIDVYNL